MQGPHVDPVCRTCRCKKKGPFREPLLRSARFAQGVGVKVKSFITSAMDIATFADWVW